MRMERTSSHAILNSFCRILRATCYAVVSVVSTARTHEVFAIWKFSTLQLFPLILFINYSDTICTYANIGVMHVGLFP